MTRLVITKSIHILPIDFLYYKWCKLYMLQFAYAKSYAASSKSTVDKLMSSQLQTTPI